MATRSRPIVSCLFIAWATASLVPTPSDPAASSGFSYSPRAKSPANPPSPPRTSGRVAFFASGAKSSTARSPASMSTPASA